MNTKQLLDLGVPLGEPMAAAFKFAKEFCAAGGDGQRLAAEVAAVVEAPGRFADDELRGGLARALLAPDLYRARATPAPWQRWGADGEVDEMAVTQMELACRLPLAVSGALMPDAHVGYGLPIGGVLAVDGAVIPYAVGVDIACRMRLSALDLPVAWLEQQRERLGAALERETKFGVGAMFRERKTHAVLDEDWTFCRPVRENRDRAHGQLGTSGSGNHFVEFGLLTVSDAAAGLPAGEYVALLSHSGSRGAGAAVCNFYSKRAAEAHPELPRELSRLAWLALDSADGQEYWRAMNLMGRYAAANHELIHTAVAAKLGAAALLVIENHHNFAWLETHGGREVVVHRKGATPAGAGALGVIPGSMATPGYVVRGLGNALSLNSASHGAGRRMSRTQANETLSWREANALLRERGVTLLSAGLDEVPFAYKDIGAVMAAQRDLVEPLARFDPRVVKMCPGGERAED